MEALLYRMIDSIIAFGGMQSSPPPGESMMARTIVHKGRKIQVAVDESPGRDGQIVRRDVVLHPGAVAILPLLDAGRVCLLRNERPNVGETLWEIPAGTLEPGEPIEQAAVRELAEETGYRAGRLRQIHAFYPSPGVLSERTHLFVAEDLTPGEMRLEADESIEPRIVEWEQAFAWCLDGTIRDAKSLVAIMLWNQLRGRD
jgi:ADP-ribose pyrophosphatase